MAVIRSWIIATITDEYVAIIQWSRLIMLILQKLKYKKSQRVNKDNFYQNMSQDVIFTCDLAGWDLTRSRISVGVHFAKCLKCETLFLK